MIVNVEIRKDDELNSENKYNNPLEIKKIKKLLNLEELEYASPVIKDILQIKKNNISYLVNKEKCDFSFRVILYLRLSVEDGDLIDGDVSKSIRNQLLLLLDECNKNKWRVVGIFCEDGISGGDDNRPEWKKSLKFCECNRTDIMLCKSQSRFSRSMEMIEKYLHTEFIKWGIRFVGIVDKADTNNKGNKKTRQINGLTNEWQIEDQSINVRRIMQNKRQNGLFISANPPYGYLRDEKDKEHLVIDNEAAEVIRRIYKEYLDGVNCHCIARKLNEDLIPTRIEHMKKVGVNIGKSKAPRIINYKTEKGDTLKSIAEKYNLFPIEIIETNNIMEHLDMSIMKKEISERELIEGHILKIPKKIIWDDGMIREILRNEIYTGCLVYGKTVNKSYKDRTKIRISRQEWNKVLNCHEAIIERDVWEKVRDKLLSNTNNTRTTGKNLFAKKLYCSCCGRGMQKSKDTRNGQGDYYISCRTVNKVGRFCDNRKQIAKSVLEKIILDKINEQLDKYYDKKIVEDKYNDIKYGNIANQIEKLKMQYNNLEYTLTEKTNRLSILYEDRVNGTLTLEEFKTLKQNIDNEILKYSNERNNIDLQIKELEEQRLKNDFEQNELFEKYRRIEALTPEILNEFVEKIYLGKYNEASNSREIKIIWNIDKKEEIV